MQPNLCIKGLNKAHYSINLAVTLTYQVSTMAATTVSRNQALLRALSHRSSPDLKIPSELAHEDDIKALFLMFLNMSGNEEKLLNKDEVMKWVDFASSFLAVSEASFSKLEALNEGLTKKSVLLGDGFKTSEADVIVYSALHSFLNNLPNSDRQKIPNVLRWLDYVQNKENFGEYLEKLQVEKVPFEVPARKLPTGKEDAEKLVSEKDASHSKGSENIEVNASQTKATSEACGGNKTSKAKKVEPQKELIDKDKDVSVSLLNIQVGLIRKAWKHPSADSLLVEEIDLGDGNLRQVVSGLAKYCTPEELTNRLVVLVTNVKPGKLRDVMSAGLVLCASNEDHSVVEPLLPPQGALPGERISFAGHEGKPEDVLNPKKKQLEKITPHLRTDNNGVATFKEIPFMTSCGPCTSSIPNAGIK